MSSPQTAVSEEILPEAMRGFIQRIATGPEMSKDLSREEARDGMRLVLQDRVDPVQMGIFLIALRMKRETDEENLGILDALLEATETVTATVPRVVTLTDPFNGYNRILPASPFLPAVLAACGVPTVAQGVESVGPKFGITHHLVLEAAGVTVGHTPGDVAERLAGAGWGYVDQRLYAPQVNRLVGLRRMMVKLSVITTAEVIPPSVRGAEASHLVTGYVHKPYPRIYGLLARSAGYESSLLMRGVEGGVVPSLRQKATAYVYGPAGEGRALETEPTAIGIHQAQRAVSLPDHLAGDHFDAASAAAMAAEQGMAALAGRGGATADSLVYGAALVLFGLARAGSLEEGAAHARRVLASGEAKARFAA